MSIDDKPGRRMHYAARIPLLNMFVYAPLSGKALNFFALT